MKQIIKQPVQFIFTAEETKEILKYSPPEVDEADVSLYIVNFLISNSVISKESEFEILKHNWWLGCNELGVEGFLISEKEVIMDEVLSF